MPKEIERKFLVKELPKNIGCFHSEKIRQGYVVLNQDGSEERVREKGKKFYRTWKSEGSISRDERESEINQKEFKLGWTKSQGKTIEKTRYYIPYGKFTIEIDIYSGKLKGLVVAEIEFESEQESNSFTPTDWLGEEITNREEFKNKNLAKLSNIGNL